MSLNSVILHGRLTRDPELKTTAKGTNYCQFTLAVSRGSKDAGADFIDCVAWNNTAELMAKWLKKGNPIIVDGNLRQSSWEKDGQKHSRLDVAVRNITFAGDKSSEESSAKSVPVEQKDYEPTDIPVGDIPF